MSECNWTIDDLELLPEPGSEIFITGYGSSSFDWCTGTSGCGYSELELDGKGIVQSYGGLSQIEITGYGLVAQSIGYSELCLDGFSFVPSILELPIPLFKGALNQEYRITAELLLETPTLVGELRQVQRLDVAITLPLVLLTAELDYYTTIQADITLLLPQLTAKLTQQFLLEAAITLPMVEAASVSMLSGLAIGLVAGPVGAALTPDGSPSGAGTWASTDRTYGVGAWTEIELAKFETDLVADQSTYTMWVTNVNTLATGALNVTPIDIASGDDALYFAYSDKLCKIS